MRKPKILVVGSFVMDQIARTEVFPNQGETVLGLEFSKAPGGKGANQAVQAARLGADVTMIGKLGYDSNGEELKKTCEEAGIDTSFVLYDPTGPSGCSVIILECAPGRQTQNRIIVLSGSNMTIRKEEVAFLEGQIDAYDLVILQLEIPMEINVCVAQMAHKKGVPVMLNCAPYAPIPDELFACLSYISPNEHEMSAMSGIPLERSGDGIDPEAIRRACERVHEKGVANVLVTLGESGAVYDSAQGYVFSPCAKGVQAVDPTAAGDSFVAAFSTGVSCGWDTETILSFANHTAAITVSSMGAMPSLPYLADVERFMQEKGIPLPDTSCLK